MATPTMTVPRTPAELAEMLTDSKQLAQIVESQDSLKEFITAYGAAQQSDGTELNRLVHGSDIEGGHCVTVGAYDADGLTCVTWGTTQRMTWAFFETYFDEAWVIVTPDMIDPATGLDHLGVNLAALERDFTALTGTALGHPDRSVTA